jgi:hypothetical protein
VAVDDPAAIRLVRRISTINRAADIHRLFRTDLPGLCRTDRTRVIRGYLGEEWFEPAVRRTYMNGIA